MGNYNITIRGVGQHHNHTAAPSTRKKDAEVMAAKFVADLRAAGHSIASATVTHGGEVELLDNAGLLRDAAAEDDPVDE